MVYRACYPPPVSTIQPLPPERNTGGAMSATIFRGEIDSIIPRQFNGPDIGDLFYQGNLYTLSTMTVTDPPNEYDFSGTTLNGPSFQISFDAYPFGQASNFTFSVDGQSVGTVVGSFDWYDNALDVSTPIPVTAPWDWLGVGFFCLIMCGMLAFSTRDNE